MNSKSVLRTCVGCRDIVERNQLIRIIQIKGTLVVDHKKGLGLRGANIHPSSKCLNWAIKNRAFHKALKFSGELNTSQVLKDLSSEVPYEMSLQLPNGEKPMSTK